MKRVHWMLILVLIGFIAGSWQVGLKAASEPWHRSITLAIDYAELAFLGDMALELEQLGYHAILTDIPLDSGLTTVARVTEDNYGIWRETEAAAEIVLFDRNQWPAGVAELEAVFASQLFGFVELMPVGDFASQPEAFLGRLVRVYDRPAHVFTSEFVAAVRERQADLLVVRLFADWSPDQNVARLAEISSALQAEGHTLGPLPNARPVFPVSRVVFLLQAIALGAIASLGLLFLGGERVPRIIVWVLPAAGMLAAVVAVRVLGPILSRQLFALAAAITYPSVGFLSWWQSEGKKSTMLQPVLDVLRLTAYSAVGGIAVLSFLAHPAFQFKTAQFLGVKLAYGVPLLLSGLLLGWACLRFLLSSERPSFSLGSRWLALGGLLLVAGAIFVLFNRTGNQSLVPIGQLELQIREFLFRVLWARPRTKEVFGYPLLLMGFWLWPTRAKLLAAGAIILGYIGQLSLVNTFEHAHHPVLLSLARTSIGLVLGLSGGLLLLVLVLRFSGRLNLGVGR